MSDTKWYQELTAYQWRVLVCACLGWALDIMDGYLYAIILFPAMSDLLGTAESAVMVRRDCAEHLHGRLGAGRTDFWTHR